MRRVLFPLVALLGGAVALADAELPPPPPLPSQTLADLAAIDPDTLDPPAQIAWRFGYMIGRHPAERGVRFDPHVLAATLYTARHGAPDVLSDRERHHFARTMYAGPRRAGAASFPRPDGPIRVDRVPDLDEPADAHAYVLGRRAADRFVDLEIPDRWPELIAGVFAGADAAAAVAPPPAAFTLTRDLQAHIDRVYADRSAMRAREGAALRRRLARDADWERLPSGSLVRVIDPGGGGHGGGHPADADDAVRFAYVATDAAGRPHHAIPEAAADRMQWPVPTLAPGFAEVATRWPAGARLDVVMPPAAHGFASDLKHPEAATTLRFDLRVRAVVRYPAFLETLAADERPPPAAGVQVEAATKGVAAD